jgi:basic membrane protein A
VVGRQGRRDRHRLDRRRGAGRSEDQARGREVAGLKDGSFVIWKGPILGQDGKEVLAKDAVADDKFLGGINFYVKGVDGVIPSSK